VDLTWGWRWYGWRMPGLLLIALLLLPFDIAVRRLALDVNDLNRALNWLRARLRTAPVGGAAPELARLKQRKAGAFADRKLPDGANGVGVSVASVRGDSEPATPVSDLGAVDLPETAGRRASAPATARPLTRPPLQTVQVDASEDGHATAQAPPTEVEAGAKSADEDGMSRLMAAKRRARERQERPHE